MQSKFSKRLCMLLASVTTAAFMLGGCSDGKNGLNGANGANGLNAGQGTVSLTSLSAEDQAKVTFKGEVSSVTINSPPVIKFKVSDANGNPVVGLGAMDTTTTPPR